MWDPAQYLAFAGHRSRPFYDLTARVGATHPRVVVDVGCGPGNLTTTLRDRWPESQVRALDSSPEMIEAAAARGVDAELADLREWTPESNVDVIVSNAVLQWVPGHQKVLRRWIDALADGAWLAFQVPGNFDAPSHALVREVAESPRWRPILEAVRLRGESTVADPVDYADLFTDAGCTVDAWETTYTQRLDGADPVLRWIEGTALRPIKAALDDEQWTRFQADLAPRLREAYPRRVNGTTWFPFRRIFVVGRVGREPSA
jgi:trans-aconitate 2-methyltransferase